MADRIYAHHHAVAFLACPGHVPALSTNMNRFEHKRLAWSLDHYHHSNSKTLMAIKHRPQKLELMSSRGFQCCCKHLLPRLWQDLTLKHPLVRSGLLANSKSIVSELITCQTLLEAWNLCIHANWQVKTDERMIHWCRCQTSHLAMQHLRATALWNKWLDISFPTSNNYPSILILLAQQILKGKRKQKKKNKEVEE